MKNEVYYRIYRSQENEVVFVCMQDFDENDYDQDRFLNDEHYETEQEAKDAFLLMRAKAERLLAYKVDL